MREPLGPPMPLLAFAPGPWPASLSMAEARVGWAWFVWGWLHAYARPIHEWRWRRLMRRFEPWVRGQ